MTEKEPIVSIITPTFNRAEFIEEAIQSVLDQTEGEFELLVVDDGSTDATKELLAPYLKDSRVKYFYQENQGQSVARNRGLAESRGEFFCFIDSDNVWLPDKLERQLEFMDSHPNIDIVYGDIISIDENSRETGRQNMARFSGDITAILLRDNFVSINTSMVRRRCYLDMGGFNEKDRLAEDYDLWLRYSTRYRFHYLPGYFVRYRVMKDQISSDKKARFWANELTLRQFLDAHPHSVGWVDKQKGWSVFHARKSRYLSQRGEMTLALISALRSIALWPFQSAGWRAMARAFLPGKPHVA